MPITPSPSSSMIAAVNRAHLNNVRLEMALLGIYTTVYFGTLYIYTKNIKSSGRSWIVSGTISLLYILYVAQASIAWTMSARFDVEIHHMQCALLASSPFLGTSSTVVASAAALNACNYLMAILSDGLMIWRCFHLWNRSLRSISVPSLLLLCEIGMYLTILIIASKDQNDLPPNRYIIIRKLIVTGLFMTLTTTLLSTLLISYRIHFISKNTFDVTKTWCKYLREIFIESSAAYSMVTLAFAIAVAIPLTADNFVPLLAARCYTSNFYTFTAGVAPTIMVARVASSSNKKFPEVLGPLELSNMQFPNRVSIQQSVYTKCDYAIKAPGVSVDLEMDVSSLVAQAF